MNWIKGLSAVGGAGISYLYGEWVQALTVLLFLVVFDYVTGFAAAGYQGQLSSRVGLYGIARKMFIFLIVALSHQIDLMLGTSLVMEASIYFYLANEALSMIENAGKLGLPVPSVLKKAVATFQEKGGGADGN